MADINTQAKATITAEDKTGNVFSQVGAKMKSAETSAGNLSKGFSDLGNIVKTYLGYQALRTTVAFFESTMQAAGEAQSAVAQLNAVLESTGNAAGVTAQQMIELSGALQKESTYSDEAILSATNLLLTFTNIKGNVIPDATRIVLDMSAALGTDLKDSAIQVGKALQDPILGVTALRRVGVNFNQAQQEMIKGLVDAGKSAQAQAYIMKELNTEFGGSAQAQLSSYQGQVKALQNEWDDFKEVIGNALLPVMQTVMGGLSGMIKGFDLNNQAAQLWGQEMVRNFAKVGSVLENLGKAAWTSMTGGPAGTFKAGFSLFGDIKNDFATINAGIDDWEKTTTDAWEKFGYGIDSAKGGLAGLARDGGDDLGSVASKTQSLQDAFKALSKTIVSAIDDQSSAVKDLKKQLSDLDSQLSDSLDKAHTDYQKKVVDIARSAEGRIADIDKQIAQEETSRSAGFRTRIENLQAEKAKEQDIIRRSRQQVSDLQAQLNKDDLQQAASDYAAQIAELQKANTKKKTEIQNEINARDAFAKQLGIDASSSTFLSAAAKEGTTFAGSIGAGKYQSQLVFNFSGDITGDDGISKIKAAVIAALNREATLRGVAGK